MKIAYLDCFSGISGDMTVGAFLDAGLKLSLLRKRLAALKLTGYRIDAGKTIRGMIKGTKFNVIVTQKRALKRVTLPDIRNLINQSRLRKPVKELSVSIFERLAEAESKIHGVKKEQVHFHEVGAIDSIVDIVSTAIAVDELGVERFYCLNIRCGKGLVNTLHGNIPLPPPAVLEMLKNTPATFSDIEFELVTPTGAAILTTLVKDFKLKPEIQIESIGYGAGSFDLEGTPNLLRVIAGASENAVLAQDEIVVIETNIDDMNPVFYEYLIERLFEEGALDVYITPVYMKKTRPAVLLTVLANGHLLDKLAKLIMRETTSSGVRYYKAQRKKLDRITKTVRTKYGSVRVKVNYGPEGIKTVSPEYEDCKRAARKTKAALKAVFDAARDKLS